ncbi:MAG: ATPase [Chloroflexi bacterium]|nr:ATPase [Chloroflexota bacterium]
MVKQREFLVFLLLIALIIIIGIINHNFLKPASLLSILDTSLILILVSIGEMFVILTRGIDVSVGASMGISAVILGLSLNAGIPLPISILFSLITGFLAGSINGIGVAIFKVPPIIMTLGTLGVYRGFMRVLTGGSWIETIPQNIKSMAGWDFLGVSVLAWSTIVITLLTFYILRRLKQARYFYAVGDNEEGAFLLGIPVNTTLFSAYALAGLFAGMAAVIFVARIGFVPMQTGAGLELQAIAASVLGGVNLMGGVGTPISALVGGLFLTVINSVLVYLKVPAFWNNAIAGAILIIVVLIDFHIRRSIEIDQRRARAQVRAERIATAKVQLSGEEMV